MNRFFSFVQAPLLVLLLLFSQSYHAQTPISVVFRGSSTVGQGLMEHLIVSYLRSQNAANLRIRNEGQPTQIVDATLANGQPLSAEIISEGTNAGLQAFYSGKCDVAMASRRMTSDEVAQAPSGMYMVEVPLCMDAIAVIVNPENPIRQLSTQQIRDIFSGKITDWSAISPEFPGKIHVYSQPRSSGSHDVFQENVLLEANISAMSIENVDQSVLASTVAIDDMAIGYVGLSFVGDAVAIALPARESARYVKPGPSSLLNDSYPVARRLYLYIRDTNAPFIKEFLGFIKTSEISQATIIESGFMPLYPREEHSDNH